MLLFHAIISVLSVFHVHYVYSWHLILTFLPFYIFINYY